MSLALKILTVPVDEDGTRLDRYLRRQIADLSQAQIEKLLRGGKIRIDGTKVKSNFRITAQMQISVPAFLFTPDVKTGPKPSGNKPPEKGMDPTLAQKALAEMEVDTSPDWLALNKPAGLAVQGGTGTNRHIDAMLCAAYPEARLRLVHRIDKDTSGLLLVARKLESARQLTRFFADRQIQKSYLAIVIGDPGPSGCINASLAKIGGNGHQKMVAGHMQDDTQTQSAESLYLRLAQMGQFALVALRPLTGRTHQLRVHMASHGTPILGDGKYAGAKAHPSAQFARQLHLHAQFLTLPDGKNLSAALPAHFRDAIEVLDCQALVPSSMPDFFAPKAKRRPK